MNREACQTMRGRRERDVVEDTHSKRRARDIGTSRAEVLIMTFSFSYEGGNRVIKSQGPKLGILGVWGSPLPFGLLEIRLRIPWTPIQHLFFPC